MDDCAIWSVLLAIHYRSALPARARSLSLSPLFLTDRRFAETRLVSLLEAEVLYRFSW